MLEQHFTETSNTRINSSHYSKESLGQFMTPPSIAEFMARLFEVSSDDKIHLLDAGAGQGSLSCAFLRRLQLKTFVNNTGKISLYEIDDNFIPLLQANILRENIHLFNYSIINDDFINIASEMIMQGLQLFTHAILNPPYKKINTTSCHKKILRKAGIEATNQYSAFVSLALLLLNKNGQLVAIIPRSFCNGPYFKHFRQLILKCFSIKHIHLFKSRDKAFARDKVLQENCIIYLKKCTQSESVVISTSNDDLFDDYVEKTHYFSEIVEPEDLNFFIRIPTSHSVKKIKTNKSTTLDCIGISVSTGPIVDFRLKHWLRDFPSDDDVPLLYPAHFKDGFHWPKENFKKFNAIHRCEETKKFLYPNGFYVVVRRMSSKEERKRINAFLVEPTKFPKIQFIGFENHFNVFHINKNGMPENIARGLSCFLNSSFTDEAFRVFNGHTQVNATDLRALKYPSLREIESIGAWAKVIGEKLSQKEIDIKMESLGYGQN